MPAMIAIRKRTRLSGMGLSGLAVAEKRSELSDVLSRSPSTHSPRLYSLGLTNIAETPDVAPDTAAFRRLPYVGAYVVQADNRSRLAEARRELTDDYHIMPDVQLSLPNPVASGRRMPAESAMSTFQGWPDASGIATARSHDNHGAGVVVGVLDSGCDADHSEFSGRTVDYAWVPLDTSAPVRSVRGFDPHNHGTHVSAIIAGANMGIAPQADLLVASVIESETLTTSLQRIVNGLDWMLQRIALPENREKPVIINMSLGFKPEWLKPSEANTVMIGIRLLLQQLVEDFDVLPIVAIGNDGPGTVRAPGYYPETLAVGAVDSTHGPAWFSGGGPGPAPFDTVVTPDVAGYGVDVLSAIERDIQGRSWYEAKDGTSMATPYVSGIAALVAAKTRLHGKQLREHLLQNALPLPHPPERVGAGLARYVI